MSDAPTFQIPRDVIEPIIQAHVAAAITTALGGQARLIETAVAQVLNAKVGSDGQPSRGYGSDVPFIQWAMQKVVRDATQKAIEEEFGKHADLLRKMLVAEMGKSKSPLVKSLVEGMVGAMTNPNALKYRIKVEYGE